MPDTTLDGIFVSDSRDSGQVVTYTARRGAIVRTGPNSSFLIMQDGVIQRENKAERSISMIEFRSYAFDLSSFTGGSMAATYQPSERSTSYLLDPDPNDPVYQQIPGRFRSELHDRITAPLSVLVFALLPLAFLGEPRTNRQGRGRTIAGIALAGALIREVQFLLIPGAAANPGLIPVMYAVPLGVVAFCLAGTLGLIPMHLPLPLARAVDRFWLRLSRLFRRESPAASARRSP
jgi:lipopolysaccharide export system permease protein